MSSAAESSPQQRSNDLGGLSDRFRAANLQQHVSKSRPNMRDRSSHYISRGGNEEGNESNSDVDITTAGHDEGSVSPENHQSSDGSTASNISGPVEA
eukprot:scaffold155319_cov32-Prasinocladus_malaysianus.AAC.3